MGEGEEESEGEEEDGEGEEKGWSEWQGTRSKSPRNESDTWQWQTDSTDTEHHCRPWDECEEGALGERSYEDPDSGKNLCLSILERAIGLLWSVHTSTFVTAAVMQESKIETT